MSPFEGIRGGAARERLRIATGGVGAPRTGLEPGLDQRRVALKRRTETSENPLVSSPARRARTPAGTCPRDAGYTLVEVVVTIALAGTLMGIAVSGWQGWARASAQEGAVTELRGVLRQAQQRAVTTGTSTCVLFDADDESWTVWRGRCDSSAKVRLEGPVPAEDGIDLAQPRFQHDATTYLAGVSFAPRGTATPGSVEVRRDGGGTTDTVRVEGLTGRVSSS